MGVVGAITPWNYPLLMAVWKLAPILAAGNCVVLKPAEQAPLSCTRLAQLFVDAGGPPGVFNLVNGLGPEAGRALALHPHVIKLSFTGSTAVGKLLLAYAGQSNMKRVALETGGKSPQIFLPDLYDLDAAATSMMNSCAASRPERHRLTAPVTRWTQPPRWGPWPAKPSCAMYRRAWPEGWQKVPNC
jgi:acyl-CoA reductase-like NAD-dependent aldehyde dehydrogenase